MKECFEFAIEAFDLAEQLQTPVFVLSDLDLGMNNWMSEPFEYPEKPIRARQSARRGAAEGTWRICAATRTSMETGFRIARCLERTIRPPRTLRAVPATTRRPCIRSAPRTTRTTCCGWRGSSRQPRRWFRSRSLKARARQKVGIIAFGTSHWAMVESRDQLERECEIATDYLRVRAYPVYAGDARLCRPA